MHTQSSFKSCPKCQGVGQIGYYFYNDRLKYGSRSSQYTITDKEPYPCETCQGTGKVLINLPELISLIKTTLELEKTSAKLNYEFEQKFEECSGPSGPRDGCNQRALWRTFCHRHETEAQLVADSKRGLAFTNRLAYEDILPILETSVKKE